MPKINCNDGCLDNVSAECVKYTGTEIPNPVIIQNTNYNDIINILVDKILSLPGAIDVYITTPIDPLTITNTILNTAFPTALIGFSVYYSNITGSPSTIYKYSKYTATEWAYIILTKAAT